MSYKGMSLYTPTLGETSLRAINVPAIVDQTPCHVLTGGGLTGFENNVPILSRDIGISHFSRTPEMLLITGLSTKGVNILQ